MMSKQFLSVLTFFRMAILLSFFAGNPLFAKPLYIEITGGRNYGIPIAVLPFYGDSLRAPLPESISNVIRNDLGNSGQFQVLQIDRGETLPRQVNDINYAHWQGLGAEKLVFGTITQQPNGLLGVEVQLFDLYKDSDLPLAHVRFSDKRPEQMRALGHYISDVIFEKLMGVRGFFSTRIAYITQDRRGRDIMNHLTIADADGRNDRVLLSSPYPLMSPKWSPDARKIAFVSFHGNRSAVKMVDIATGQITLISRSPGINGAPAWSPDGRQLALVLSKDGAPRVYLYDLISRTFQRLTNGPGIDTEPFWAPDGKSIVFTSDRGGKAQIYRVTLASGTIERVTFKGDYNAAPSLTPDGKQLIVMHRDEVGNFNIAVQELTSGRLRILTRTRQDESPTIAPNGMMVMFGRLEDNQTVLGAVSLDGRFQMRLPVQEGHVKEPAWSPFF